MTVSLKSAVAGVATLAVVGGMLVAAGGAASAATISPFDPAGNGATVGTISFYDAAGTKIVGGPLATAPAYVRADTDTGRTGDTKATMYLATPVKGTDPGTWPNDIASAAATYPSATTPASIAGPNALAKSVLTWFDPTSGWQTLFANVNSDPAWQNLYQVRILTSGAGQAVDASRYSSATVKIDTAAGTWTQVYPEVVAGSSTTTLGVSPASPQLAGTPVTLTATVAPATAGTVTFKAGATTLGTGAVNGAGVATFSWSGGTLAGSPYSLTAVFASSDPLVAGSTSAAVPYSFTAAPAADTTTALSATPNPATAFAPVALHADVTRTTGGAAVGAGTGTVKFFDGGTLLGSAPVTATGADLSYSSFSAGTKSLTATFTPADPASLKTSTSAAVPLTVTAGAGAQPDPQTITVSVTPGSLSISTPYTPTNPFDLGTLVLNPNGTALSVSKAFGTVDPGATGITIIDTRAGDLPWTAAAQVGNFVGADDEINGQNLSFTGVVPLYATGNALNAATKPVVVNDVTSTPPGGLPYAPAAAGADGLKGTAHTFATAVRGAGTVYVGGNLNLLAPTSTKAGLYTATLTFTIS